MSVGAPGPGDDYIAPICPNCRMNVPEEAVFCPHCGTRLKDAPVQSHAPPPRYQPLPRPTSLLDVGRGIASYTSLVLLVLIAVNIGILVGSVGMVSGELISKDFSLYLVTPWIVDIVEIGGEVLVGYFIFLVIAIVTSFLWMVRKSVVGFARELRLKPLRGGHSPVYLMATLFFALIAFNFFYYIGLGAGGIDPGTPDFTDDSLWKLIFAFANASVWEELVTRVLFIGVPLLFVDLARRGGMRWKNYVLGGGFKLCKPEIVLLVFSSAMFALAHISSWDTYKMPPTFIAGLALGYLFLRVGLYAAIMLHFTVDFISMPIEVTQSLDVTLVIGVLVLAWIILGSCYFVYYSTRVVEFVFAKKIWPPRILSPGPRPIIYRANERTPTTQRTETETQRDPQPRGGFEFSCKFCGHTEAQYKDGGLYCLRCGRRN